MEIQHLRTFLTVAEAGSLTQAADSLFLSQPAVSGQIKALELELGVQLFRRASRGMVLTDAGKLLLKEARDVVHRVDGVARLAERLRGDVAGTLRLGIVDCGYELELARMVGIMIQRHRDVEVKLLASNSGENTKAIIEQDIDMAIVEGDKQDDRIRYQRLGTSRVGVIGPIEWKDDLIDAGWARLAEFPWIFQSQGCSYCALLRRLCAEHHVEFTPKFHVEAFGAVKDLVAEGLALSVADLDDIAPLVDSERVFVWPHLQVEMPVWLITLESRHKEPILTAFAEIAAMVHDRSTRRQAKRV